jgi:hypothetical protein
MLWASGIGQVKAKVYVPPSAPYLYVYLAAPLHPSQLPKSVARFSFVEFGVAVLTVYTRCYVPPMATAELYN